MTTGSDFDFLVVGGGSAGMRAAAVARAAGAHTAIVERRSWGGTCVGRGCIPKKLLVFAAEARDACSSAHVFGMDVETPSVDWPRLRAAVHRRVELIATSRRAALERRGITLLDGEAKLVGERRVAVDGRELRAQHVLLATGSAPERLPVEGAHLAATSDDVFTMPELPREVVVVGAGYVGVEMAHLLAALGSRVTLLESKDEVLHGFDPDVRAAVHEGLVHAGIDVRTRARAGAVRRRDDRLRVALEGAPETAALDADFVLAALGRKPSVDGLGLEELGVRFDEDGKLVLDDGLTTNLPWLHAAGDVAARVPLTPVAIREGDLVARRLFSGGAPAIRYDMVPTAVFTSPPAAKIGSSETEARARGEIDVYVARFTPLEWALADDGRRAMLKLVVDRASGRVLGLHAVAPHAPEIVQAAAIAISMGATKEHFDTTLAIHPTVAEELLFMREPRPS